MREIVLVHLDKTRPALVLTREAARSALRNVTIAPITSRVRGLSSEVPLGTQNGLDQPSVASLDNIQTVRASELGRTVGYLLPEQEKALATAAILAFDLDVALPGGPGVD